VKDDHVKDAAQNVVKDVPRGAGLGLWPSGARAARALLAMPPPPKPLSLRSWRFVEMGAQLGSSVAFGSGCGQALPGLPRKAHLCWFKGKKRRGNCFLKELKKKRTGRTNWKNDPDAKKMKAAKIPVKAMAGHGSKLIPTVVVAVQDPKKLKTKHPKKVAAQAKPSAKPIGLEALNDGFRV